MADLAYDVAKLHNRMSDLSQQVEVLHGDFALLTKANTEITSRVDSIDRTLMRLESHLFSEKAVGKSIVGTSLPDNQVRSSNLPRTMEENQLGYQGISEALANRSGMLKKVELPHFSGSHPNIWIHRAERFFRLGNYSDQDKFDLISVSFEGPVLTWFNIELLQIPFHDWDDFKRRLVNRFTQRLEEDRRKQLFAIRQRASISAPCPEDQKNPEECENIGANIVELEDPVENIGAKLVRQAASKTNDLAGDGTTTSVVLAQGLIAEGVKVVAAGANPVLITRGIEKTTKALVAELKNMSKETKETKNMSKNMYVVDKKTKELRAKDDDGVDIADDLDSPKTVPHTKLIQTSRVQKGSAYKGNDKPLWNPQNQGSTSNSRRLSPAEVAEHRRQGLCFKCDAKWSRAHVCSQLELQVLTVLDGCEVELTNEDMTETVGEGNGTFTELRELSLSSFLGLSSPKTTKLWGKMGKLNVIVMLDSGATHHFMDPSLLNKIHVIPLYNKPLDITLGYGITVNGAGVCHVITFTLSTLEDVADVIVLELGGVDLIYVKCSLRLTFDLGILVFLKSRPDRQQSMAKCPYQKLAARYDGPFEVVEPWQLRL